MTDITLEQRARELLAAECKKPCSYDEPHIPTRHAHAAIEAALRLSAQQADADEDAYVIDALAHLLAEISVIVNGPEPAGTKWSYHDLPAKVAAMKGGAQ